MTVMGSGSVKICEGPLDLGFSASIGSIGVSEMGMYDLMGLGWNSIWVVLVIIVDRLCLLGIGFGKGW